MLKRWEMWTCHHLLLAERFLPHLKLVWGLGHLSGLSYSSFLSLSLSLPFSGRQLAMTIILLILPLSLKQTDNHARMTRAFVSSKGQDSLYICACWSRSYLAGDIFFSTQSFFKKAMNLIRQLYLAHIRHQGPFCMSLWVSFRIALAEYSRLSLTQTLISSLYFNSFYLKLLLYQI